MRDDKNLISRCQKGEKKAFDKFYEIYSPLIFGICLRYANNTVEAEDLFQESFIKILDKINEYRFEGSFEGWLKRLVVNNAISFLQANHKCFYENIDDLEIADIYFDCDILDQMDEQEIISIINELPVGYRTIFNLYVIEGYKHIEIAEILKISDNTSRTQFKKARKFLIEIIEKKYNGRI